MLNILCANISRFIKKVIIETRIFNSEFIKNVTSVIYTEYNSRMESVNYLKKYTSHGKVKKH